MNFKIKPIYKIITAAVVITGITYTFSKQNENYSKIKDDQNISIDSLISLNGEISLEANRNYDAIVNHYGTDIEYEDNFKRVNFNKLWNYNEQIKDRIKTIYALKEQFKHSKINSKEWKDLLQTQDSINNITQNEYDSINLIREKFQKISDKL